MVGLLYGICVSILRRMGDQIAASFPNWRSEVIMEFEWNEIKAAINLNNHGVNFEEAKEENVF
ncbi:MAG: hypothetical protein ACBR23_02045 [Microcoleus sp.]|uniref:hypothetical protein n=1 Tax=Microcoleus sp. TaxID=44472 RepID=UPI0035262923